MSLKSEIIHYSRLCYKNNFLSAKDGNISVRTRENYILTTAAGICKGKLNEKNLIKMDFKGRKISGKGAASSEFKMHRYIYEQRKDPYLELASENIFRFGTSGAGRRRPTPPRRSRAAG